MDFVIIGGDAAGMSAASRAKRNNPELHVMVLEMTNDVSYSACSMPYNIAEPDREMDDLIVRSPQAFRERQGIDLRLGHWVSGIDAENKTVSGKNADGDFEIPFDKLLIATGSTANRPLIPGHELDNVFVLKALEDGRQVKRYIAAHDVKKAAIIGAGYIGLEMCEALVERDIEVQLIRNRPGLLPWLHPDLSQVILDEIDHRKVLLNPGCTVERIAEEGRRLDICCTQECFDADMVLMAIGVRANSAMARDAGLALGHGNAIAVNACMQTSHPDIYACGDCAEATHVVTGEKTWVPLALYANRGGWAVADHITGRPVRMAGVAGTGVFKFFDLQIARTGLSLEEARAAGFDAERIVIKTRSRAGTVPGARRTWVEMIGDRKTGRLLGVNMVGRDGEARRINTAAMALHAKLTVDQLSTADLAYAPPFSPVWDPLLVAANQLAKKL